MDIEKIKRGAKLMQEAESIFAGGPLGFYLTEMADAHDLLMSRFAPFKVGDDAFLTRNIDEAAQNGWRHWSHLMREGARVRVVEAGCGSSGFWFNVTFYDDGGREKAVFRLRENELRTTAEEQSA